MANTTFKEVADIFFNKIKDYSFLSLPEETAYEVAIGYIKPAISKFQSCTQSLEVDDVLQEFEEKLTDNNIQMLCNYMVIEYLDSNYILTSSALKARLSSSDFKALGQKDMLAKALEVRDVIKSENDQLAINKSYKDSKLFDIVTNRNKVGGH